MLEQHTQEMTHLLLGDYRAAATGHYSHRHSASQCHSCHSASQCHSCHKAPLIHTLPGQQRGLSTRPLYYRCQSVVPCVRPRSPLTHPHPAWQLTSKPSTWRTDLGSRMSLSNVLYRSSSRSMMAAGRRKEDSLCLRSGTS